MGIGNIKMKIRHEQARPMSNARAAPPVYKTMEGLMQPSEDEGIPIPSNLTKALDQQCWRAIPL